MGTPTLGTAAVTAGLGFSTVQEVVLLVQVQGGYFRKSQVRIFLSVLESKSILVNLSPSVSTFVVGLL